MSDFERIDDITARVLPEMLDHNPTSKSISTWDMQIIKAAGPLALAIERARHRKLSAGEQNRLISVALELSHAN